MELLNSNIVVTGAGSGIGAALCKRFAEEGPRAISLVDLDAVALDRSLQELAQVFPEVKVSSHQVDVSKESEVIALI
ncbi:MAG: SDR family NAD(P)-dependent oxidoreductase, partial [Actinobacteria bacterium]|nr:SDR family NAD(P)-dependent oxidoreductase [Actinomycetota bacterium]